MICIFCNESFFQSDDALKRKAHHGSLANLQKSATGGCTICTGLLEDLITAADGDLAKLDVQWPVYTANLRNVAGDRNFLLSFRPPSTTVKGTKLELQVRRFCVYPVAEDRSLLTQKVFAESTRSPASWAQVEDWLTTCERSHEDCRPFHEAQKDSAKRFLPSRLLDVSNDSVRLVHTQDLAMKPIYATLSHCWGKLEILRLTKENKAIFGTGIPWEELTSTFQEAISVTRQLDVRYIWIDSLCIIQDSTTDWEKEAARMEQVYGNSWCNIAAVNAKDGSEGLFRNRKFDDLMPDSVKANSMTLGKTTYRVISEDYWAAGLLHEPLYRRAWVFQERMLSPRVLHFSANQLFWTCPSFSACEVYPQGLPETLNARARRDMEWKRELSAGRLTGNLSTAQRTMQPLDEFWRTAVSNYTNCNLTQGTDKLPAIFGVLKKLRNAFGEEDYAGIWSNNMEEQLAWRVVDCKAANGGPSSRQQEYRAPSWSWASVNGVIDLPPRYQSRQYRIRIIDSVIKQKADTAVVLLGSYLRMQGHMAHLDFSKAIGRQLVWNLKTPSEELQRSGVKAYMDVDFADEVRSCPVLILAVSHNPEGHESQGWSGLGLLLRHGAEEGVFSRIGCLRISALSEAAWQDFLKAYIHVQADACSESYEMDQGHTIRLV